MKIETLNDRIANAKAKIEKKGETINKKEALIQKKEAKLQKMGYSLESDIHEVSKESSEAFWLMCDIEHLKEDIERNTSEIEETKNSLNKYELQLAGELEKESIILKEFPEAMKQMQAELIEKWDAWDIQRRNQIREDRKNLDYRTFSKKYTWADKEFGYKTDEQIHSSNIQDAKYMVLNLYYRVKNITGEITDWAELTLAPSSMGATLNGFVQGKEGRASVESILAGGYNIQRLHVRVLVHDCK